LVRTPEEPLAGGVNRIVFAPVTTSGLRVVLVGPVGSAGLRLIELKAFGPQ
jgi:hypothetical protein